MRIHQRKKLSFPPVLKVAFVLSQEGHGRIGISGGLDKFLLYIFFVLLLFVGGLRIRFDLPNRSSIQKRVFRLVLNPHNLVISISSHTI